MPEVTTLSQVVLYALPSPACPVQLSPTLSLLDKR